MCRSKGTNPALSETLYQLWVYVSASVQLAKATRQWHLLDLSQCKVYVHDPGHLRTIKVLIIT